MFIQGIAAGMSGDSNREDDRIRASMTRGERVRAAARTLRTLRSASQIAEETEVSVKTAQKYLDQLVEDNVLRRVDQGDQTLYCIDQLMATYREVATLQREHDREELTATLESMRTKISDWKETYDVETPGELRASIADLDALDEIEKRREVASEWEHLADRIPVVRAALNEYDWATERDTISV
jgi:predicted transcriptional regulator